MRAIRPALNEAAPPTTTVEVGLPTTGPEGAPVPVGAAVVAGGQLGPPGHWLPAGWEAEPLGLTEVWTLLDPGIVRVWVLTTVVVLWSVVVVRAGWLPEGTPVGLGLPVLVGVTGQTVVYHGMVSVVTLPTGQLVTLAGHLVMVYVVVVYTVLVVSCSAVEVGTAVLVLVTGQTVVDTEIVSVMVRAGQLVTVGAHEVMV